MLSRYATDSGIQIKRVGVGPVEGDTESCSGLFPQGASQADMAVKKPRAERGDTSSIFCGYQRILPGGSKRTVNDPRSRELQTCPGFPDRGLLPLSCQKDPSPTELL